MREWLAGRLIRTAHRIYRPTVTEEVRVVVNGRLVGAAAERVRVQELMRRCGISWN